MADAGTDRYEPLAAAYEPLAEVVRRAGRAYPCAIERIDANLETIVAVEPGRAGVDPELAELGRPHLERLLAAGRELHDGTVLAFEALRGRTLKARRASYFAMIACCDGLRAEYLEAIGSDISPAALPMRRRAHAAAGSDPLRNGRGRGAAIGLSVAVLCRSDDGGRELLLGLRRRELPTDAGQWHVAPSGMLEPVGETPVAGTLADEFTQELPALAGHSAEQLAALVAATRVLGVGYDLLRLRPEICLAVELSPPAPPPGSTELAPAEFSRSARLRLDRPAVDAFWASHGPDQLTPGAAAALALLEAA